MNQAQILEELHRLDVDHSSDNDGGYALLWAVKEWAQTLDSDSRRVLWDVLFELVARQDRLWSIALDTLVEEKQDQVAARLINLVKSSSARSKLKDQVVLALLRLRYEPAASMSADYLREELLRRGRDELLPALAALCRVDAETCLAISSEYFAAALKSDRLAEQHRGYVQSFLLYFLDVNDGLLPALVERTKTIQNASAKRLATLIEEELERSFNVSKYGETRVNKIRSEVFAAT